MSAPFELTIIRKSGGPLTKRISLGPDGKPLSDGSECVMSRGWAYRARFSTAKELAQLLGERESNEAILLGTLRPDLPDQVEVVTKNKLNGAAAPDVVARTAEFFVYRSAEPAFALIDFDQKGMPPEQARRLAEAGGVVAAIAATIPELMAAARVMRASTSAGLLRGDTGEELPHSGGMHTFVAVRDGADVERFLKTLHERCWLAGWGWPLVGAGGQLLDRSIVDRIVGGPERLVFEGAPVLVPPLAQDRESRRPTAIEGEALDTAAVCPPLSILEASKLRELRAREATRLAPAAAKVLDAFIDRQASEVEELRNLAHEKTGINKRTLDHKLKAARQKATARRVQQERERRLAERKDPRPQLPVPPSDAEWMPPMRAINDVLSSDSADEPPMRNPGKNVALVRGRSVPSLHFLTNNEANDDAGP
jgi:hypothetical protein